MKGYRIVWPAAKQVELEDFELPPLQPGMVLIQTDYTLVSPGTEKACLLAMPNTSRVFPQRPGYSATGRILEVGPDVTHFQAGDRVVAYHSPHASHWIKKTEHLIKIDADGVSSRDAVFIVIASMSLQGVRKARLELGESVLVVGQGLLGLFATQLAKLNGALPVIALDLDAERGRLAVKLGADHALSPAEGEVSAQIKELTRSQGADAVIEVTGSSDAMKQALTCAAPRGRVVALGCTRNPIDAFDIYQDVHKPGVAVIGAHNSVRPAHDSSPGYWTMQDDFRTLLALLAAGRLHVSPMVSEQVKPEQAPDVYRRLCEAAPSPLGVVFDWHSDEET